AEALRPDPPLCRPPKRPRLLELESDRCGERLGQRNICPGRLQGPRGAPPRPLRRLLPLARTLRPAGRPALRGFHPGRGPREYGSGESLALLQSPVAELSTRRSESLSPLNPLSGC